MCEAKVYLRDDGVEKRIMDNVVLLKPDGDTWLVVDLLGEQKLVQARLESISFINNTVHLKQVQEPSAA